MKWDGAAFKVYEAIGGSHAGERQRHTAHSSMLKSSFLATAGVGTPGALLWDVISTKNIQEYSCLIMDDYQTYME